MVLLYPPSPGPLCQNSYTIYGRALGTPSEDCQEKSSASFGFSHLLLCQPEKNLLNASMVKKLSMAVAILLKSFPNKRP